VGGRVVACIRAEEVADIPPESFLVAADAPTAPPGTVASTVPG